MKYILVLLATMTVAHAGGFAHYHNHQSGNGNNSCQGNCTKKNSHNTTNINNRTVDRSISNKNKAVNRNDINNTNKNRAVNKNDISNTNTSVALSDSVSKSKSKSNSNSDSSSQSNNSVNIEGDSIRGSAIAPSIVAMAGYSCTGASASGSAGWLGGSVGLGGTKEDRECTKRETAKALQGAILTGLYTEEQVRQMRDSSFKILMNMREVDQPTPNAKQRSQGNGYHNR